MLAILALSAGTVISTERIIDCLWGHRHPAAPRSRVQGLVSSLRRKIGDALVTRHPGYLLSTAATTIDLDECEHLARQARIAGTRDEASQYLRKALDLWRGEPLDGVSAPGIEVDRARLDELRVGLLEERFAADLELGNHAEVVAELAAVVSAHPLREGLAGQLMLALYRCNRQADALRVYQSLRRRLADELGSDPCADLRGLHASILRGERLSRLAAEPVARPRPAQLPPSVGYFTGRDRDLAALSSALRRPADEPRVLLVSGPGGLGKTALVVRWAHTVADHYGDGQIFVDLHGRHPGRTLSAASALGAVLGALGLSPPELPPTVDERAALYRTLTSGRRTLVVADDAASVAQLLPLVPPTADGQLVVTSRRRLAPLSAHHAVQAFPIEPLAPAAAHELLARMVGPGRMHDPAAAAVVGWCGGWPLAIRLVATTLAARPWQSLASFAAELAELAELADLDDVDDVDDVDDLGQLDGLDELGDLGGRDGPTGRDDQLEPVARSVRAALAGAHRTLSPAAAHLFGRLGVSTSSAFGVQLTSGIAADASVRRVRRLFDELAEAHLIVPDGPDRYRIHDIVRRFAGRRGAELVDRDVVDEWMRHRHLAPAERMADVHRI